MFTPSELMMMMMMMMMMIKHLDIACGISPLDFSDRNVLCFSYFTHLYFLI